MNSAGAAEPALRGQRVPPLIGAVLDGRYRLDSLVARGGTADVFRATDQLLGRAVAVKLFDPVKSDLNSVERHLIEMRVLASLSHPSLVAVYDARLRDEPGEGDEPSYLVMELVDGPSVADLIKQGPLDPRRAADLGSNVARALAEVHRSDLVHRDVKPANILLTADGGIKLADFGLARILTADHRVTGDALIMGTAAFFSPEQACAEPAGPASDIYSLGLVLLEALTGIREFPGDPIQSAIARLVRQPVIPPDLPTPWPALLRAMTDSDPVQRPDAVMVTEILDGNPVRETSPPDPTVVLTPIIDSTTEVIERQRDEVFPGVLWSAASPRRTRRRAVFAVAAAATVAAVAVLLMFIAPFSGTDTPADALAEVRSTPTGNPSLATSNAAPPVRSSTATAPPRTVAQTVTVGAASPTTARGPATSRMLRAPDDPVPVGLTTTAGVSRDPRPGVDRSSANPPAPKARDAGPATGHPVLAPKAATKKSKPAKPTAAANAGARNVEAATKATKDPKPAKPGKPSKPGK